MKKVIVGWGDVGDTALNRFMAGESKYDLWRTPFAYYWGLVSRGALFPVNEILPPEYFELLPKITRDRNYGVGLQRPDVLLLRRRGRLRGMRCSSSSTEIFWQTKGLEDPYG